MSRPDSCEPVTWNALLDTSDRIIRSAEIAIKQGCDHNTAYRIAIAREMFRQMTMAATMTALHMRLLPDYPK